MKKNVFSLADWGLLRLATGKAKRAAKILVRGLSGVSVTPHPVALIVSEKTPHRCARVFVEYHMQQPRTKSPECDAARPGCLNGVA
jgi:hypothetical protein